ncbi:MAG: hemerythrin domain-containing protein [Candidatus Sericytochromatia bacterium]
MKRSEELAPLSREHLSALILVYCLKHGKSSNPRYPWPTDPFEQRDKVLQMWQDELHWHFEAEESYLFDPLEPQLSPELQAVSQALRAEHQQMRDLILGLQQGQASDIAKALSQLGGILECHVKKEEQVYFAGLEREIPAEMRSQAGQAILTFYAQREPFVCVFTGERRALRF